MRTVLCIIGLVCIAFTPLEAAQEGSEAAKVDREKGRNPLDHLINQEIFDAIMSPMETVVQPVLELEQIVVTPTRTEEKLGASSSSISVITKDEIDRRHIPTVKESIRNTLSVDVVETGAYSGTTSVFMRGANANHTLILFDGIKLYDPISPNGAFNMAHIEPLNIDRIEVLRGPQSALYGTDAIGGVISMETKKAEKPFVNAEIESGSFNTIRESVEAGAKTEKLHYTVGFSQFNTGGIPHAQAKRNNPERDRYQRTSFSSRMDYDITEDLIVGGTFWYNIATFEYDEFAMDDPNLSAHHEYWTFTNYVDHRVFDWWRYIVRLGWLNSLRRDFDENDFGTQDYLRGYYSGRCFKVDYQNDLYLTGYDTLVVGFDHTEEIGDSYREQNGAVSDMPKVFARNSSLYVENRINARDRLALTQGARLDHHSHAKDHITYKIDGSYLFPWATKVRAVYATGFKSPTLYQLNAPTIPPVIFWGTAFGGFDGGNSALKPEKSESYEWGIDQYVFGGAGVISWTYFHTRFKDLIDARVDPMTWHTDRYMNVDKAYSHGNEFEIKFKPIENFETSVSYTIMETRATNTDSALLRRPDKKGKCAVSWDIFPKLETDVVVHYIGPRLDWGDNLKEYTRVDISANYTASTHVTIFGRIENLFNTGYEEVIGYSQPGIAAYGGVRGEF